VLSLFAVSGVIFHHIRYQRQTIFKIKTDLQKLTVKATNEIDAIVKLAKNEVDAVVNNLTNGKIAKSEILHQISTLILKSPNYYGLTTYYRPFETGSPYYHRICGNQKGLKFIKLEKE